MRLTESQIKQIIKEELIALLEDGDWPPIPPEAKMSLLGKLKGEPKSEPRSADVISAAGDLLLRQARKIAQNYNLDNAAMSDVAGRVQRALRLEAGRRN
tara:strand:+ start:2620 stop:2916 length:297 start_codon:yes stop_codon:yes gene_type:complete